MNTEHNIGILTLLTSMLTVVSGGRSFDALRDSYNVAKGKPVTVEPSDATCGTIPSRSTIMRPLPREPNMEYIPPIPPQETDFPEGDVERPPFEGPPPTGPGFGYVETTCAAGCAQTFPPNPAPQPVYRIDEEVVLGDPMCTPVKTLPLSGGRQPRAVGKDCKIVLEGNNILKSNRTYSFWIKPNTVDNYSNYSVILHERGDFMLLYDRLATTLHLIREIETGSKPFSIKALSPYWNHIGIHFEQSELSENYLMQLYVNNSLVVPLQLFGYVASRDFQESYLSVGSMIINELQCEILEVSQCRDLHHSYAVASGSQANRTSLPDFSQCLGAEERKEAMTLACAAFFPACGPEGIRRPCKSFCTSVLERIGDPCGEELESHPDLWNCNQYDDTDCVAGDSTFDFGLFRGTIRDFKVYDRLLTTRELYKIAQDKDVDGIYPNPGCMCPTDLPMFNYTDDPSRPWENAKQHCYDLSKRTRKQRNRVGFSENDYFFSKDFINDGAEPEIIELGEYWASTPEIDSVSITIDFLKTVQVRNVNIIFVSPLPSTGIVINRRVDGVWKPWQYYANDCATFNMKNDEVPSNFDSVICVSYEALRESPLNELGMDIPVIFFPIFGSERQGFDEEREFIDNRLLEFMRADAIKVELKGLPENEYPSKEDTTKFKYFALSEIQVDGSDYTIVKETCNIECFPGTSKFVIEPTPDSNRYKRSPTDNCMCDCREPFDREKAGAQCTPYIDSISPTYGPEYGGTVIILRGGLLSNNLDMSGEVTFQHPVLIFWEECNVTQWNDTFIICHTDTKPRPMAVNNSYYVKVRHPGTGTYQITAPEKFMFKPDPDVGKVYPLNSIVQGGVKLTVEGNNFDSVAFPFMRVQVKYNGTDPNIKYPVWTIPEACTVVNATIMLCPTPPLYEYLPREYIEKLNEDKTMIEEQQEPQSTKKKRSVKNEQNTLLDLIQDYVSFLTDKNEIKLRRKKRQTADEGITINDDDLEFTLGFILDGVPDYRDLETSLPEFSKVDVFVNPVISEFSPLVQSIPSKWPNKEVEPQIIVGENLNKGARMGDYIVTVGHEEAVVTDLLGDILTFVPPVDEPNDEGLHSQDGGKIVKLKVGNINRRVGYLKYQGWWATGAFIGIMIAIVIIILIIIAVIVYCCYRRYKDPHYLDLKRRATGNPYVGVPTKERHIIERIDPELRLQIGKALLEDPDNLLLEEEVGKGNFGKVYSGRLLNPVTREKNHVAVKTVKGDTNVDSIEDFLREAIIMKNFKSPNVLPLLGVVIKENIPYVILPFMDNGDLKTFVSNEKNRFTVRDLVSFGLDVSKGMSYLEDQRFVHRDLAARNCMVDKDRRIVIADFGLARDIYVADYYRIEDKSRPLPIRWMSIESIEIQKFTTKSDVWSFGIVLWELLSRGMKPYPGVDNLDIKRFLKRGDRLEKPSHCPPEVYEVMRKCWNTLPENRPTFRELVGMLENLLGGKKPDTPARPPETLPAATPESPPTTPTSPQRYMGMVATTPPQATYLELVDMPSKDAAIEGYLPMK